MALVDTCKAGTAVGVARGGEMSQPAGIATDATGRVYLADSNNVRIQRFDSSGNFQRTWGKDVDGVAPGTGFEICTVAANCKAGAPTTGKGGEMNAPIGVAADATGAVYVAAVFGRRIEKFDSDGNFQRTWGKDVIISGEPGDLGTGFEICTVADDCKEGVGTGSYLGGEMGLPSGVATDAVGDVYVSDQFTNRIQRFDSSGNFERTWGKNVDGGVAGTGFEICTVAANCKAADASDGSGRRDEPPRLHRHQRVGRPLRP